MSYQFIPEGQRQQIIFERALMLLGEELPLRRKLREVEFVDAASDMILWPLRTITETETHEQHMSDVRGFFADIGREVGQPPYDGSDAGVAHAWVRQALEFSGVVSEDERETFDSEEVAIIPTETFNLVLERVESVMKVMAKELAAQVE